MAQRQVALLRGINVGKAKRIAMADLRALVEGLGYTDVSTLLNSGNIVYTVPAKLRGSAAARIEAAIAKDLGVTSRITTLTADELAEAIDNNPLVEIADNPSRLLVAVLNKPTDRSLLEALMKETWTPEVLALHSRFAYAWLPTGILESRIFAAVNKVFRDGITTRNWATMLKLRAMVENGSK